MLALPGTPAAGAPAARTHGRSGRAPLAAATAAEPRPNELTPTRHGATLTFAADATATAHAAATSPRGRRRVAVDAWRRVLVPTCTEPRHAAQTVLQRGGASAGGSSCVAHGRRERGDKGLKAAQDPAAEARAFLKLGARGAWRAGRAGRPG